MLGLWFWLGLMKSFAVRCNVADCEGTPSALPSNIKLPRTESKGESCHGGAHPKLMAVLLLVVGVKVQPKPMEGDSAVQKNKIRGK